MMWLEAERGGAGVRRGACREMARGSPDTQAKVPAGLPAGGTPLELGVSSVAGLTTRGIHGRRREAARGGRREQGGTRARHMSSSATTLATAAPDSEMGGKRGPRGLRIWPGWTQRRPELGDQRGGAPPSLDAAMVARGSLPIVCIFLIGNFYV
jgi:hypothetical protein